MRVGVLFFVFFFKPLMCKMHSAIMACGIPTGYAKWHVTFCTHRIAKYAAKGILYQRHFICDSKIYLVFTSAREAACLQPFLCHVHFQGLRLCGVLLPMECYTCLSHVVMSDLSCVVYVIV